MSHRGKSTDRRLSDPGEPSQGERRRGRRADPRPRPRPPPSSKPGDHAAEAVRRPFSSPYHLIHLACIERETVPHQLGFTGQYARAARDTTCDTWPAPWTRWPRPTARLLTWRRIDDSERKQGVRHSQSSTNGTIPESRCGGF